VPHQKATFAVTKYGKKKKVTYHYENRICQSVIRARPCLVSLPDSYIRLEMVGKPVPLANTLSATVKKLVRSSSITYLQS